MISDPAALQYIFAKSGYRFPKPPDLRVLSKMINGKGIIWTEGKSLATRSNMKWSVVNF